MTNSCVIVFNGTLITSIMKRGALIVLEGCDRVGKTTQCKLLGKEESGKPHVLIFTEKFVHFQ